MTTLFGRLTHQLGRLGLNAQPAEPSATKVGRKTERVRRGSAFRWVAGGGLLARAAVYVVLGALILEISASGHSSARANADGALAEFARQPAGPAILIFLAIGLIAYAGWRFVEALSRRPQGQEVSAWTRAGWGMAGLVYVVLCLNVVKLLAGSRPEEGPQQHPASFAEQVLRLPVGPELLGLIAAAGIASGISLFVWGIRHDYGEPLETAKMKRGVVTFGRWTGVIGNGGRTIAVLLVASSFFASAVSADPEKAKSLDLALQGLAGSTFGTVLLAIVGAGFLSFGVHSIVEARYRRV